MCSFFQQQRWVFTTGESFCDLKAVKLLACTAPVSWNRINAHYVFAAIQSDYIYLQLQLGELMSLASFGSLLIPLLKLWKSSGMGFLSSVIGQNYQLLCKVNLSLRNCEQGRIFYYYFRGSCNDYCGLLFFLYSVLFSSNVVFTATVHLPSSCNSWWQVFHFLLMKFLHQQTT